MKTNDGMAFYPPAWEGRGWNPSGKAAGSGLEAPHTGGRTGRLYSNAAKQRPL
ncbi:MAG TPA: hypothetical protein VGK99_20360 [Acidobacteriota bacterium]